MRICIVFAITVSMLPAMALADTHACADCEQATVAAMIADEGVTTGDTITIPADECTWASGVTVPDEKKLVIQGAGAVSTVITYTGSGTVFALGLSGSELSNMSISGPVSATLIEVKGTGWLIHDNSLDCTTAGSAQAAMISVTNNNTGSSAQSGVIYKNTIHNGRILVQGSASQWMDECNAFWYRELGLGGTDAVYVEGNTMTRDSGIGGNHIDANYGGAYVFRYNTCDGAYIEAHSLQYNQSRGTRKWEIYNNIIGNSGSSITNPFFIRAGTGVIFNNRLTGTWGNERIAFDNVRSFTYYAGTHDGGDDAAALSDSSPEYNFPSTNADYNPGGLLVNLTDGSSGVVTAMTATTCTCVLSGGTDNNWDDGDVYRIWRDDYAVAGPCDGLSSWDGNTGDYGYPCRDQIGRGPDADLWEVDYTDNDPCGAYTQTSEPAYIWNNLKTDGVTPLTVTVVNNMGENHIQKDRDYFEEQKSGYTPCQCPHELTGLSGTCSSSIAGRGGYNLSSGVTGIGSGGSATTGGSGTITLTSP